jgi:hypothetical protein
MDANDFQGKFLKIGYSKRGQGQTLSGRNRPYIGAKGIGKLALLSCAKRVSILSKKEGHGYVGGVIDNSGLDKAITSDLTPEEYPLENLDLGVFEGLIDGFEHGTILVFDEAKDPIRSSVAHIRKMIALSFKFSLIDKDFAISVNGEPVTIEDIRDVLDSTEFVWLINGYQDEFTSALTRLKAPAIPLTTALNIKGFIGSVEKPRNLKITGTDERATIDLFVNGRLRERNILRHIPTQRLVESYIYGQIHFDSMDSGEKVDPFTTSREGVVENDKNFQSLLDYLKKDALPKIFDEWDKLRLDRGQSGDEDNPRKSKKQRRASELYSAAREDFEPGADSETKDVVDGWLSDLRTDAEFNLSSYVDCFLSENLLRQYIREFKLELDKAAPAEIRDWRAREEVRKGEANISFDIRKDQDGLTYLGMDMLALSVEGSKQRNNRQSLWSDAIAYRPVRNVVGHTGLLTNNAKNFLSLTYENIRARVKLLVSSRPK